MEAPHSGISYSQDDENNLKHLLEGFEFNFSLEDIASAYCQAGRNVYTAGEILCNLLGSTSQISSSASKGELDGVSASSEPSSEAVLGKSDAERYFSAPKQKMRGVSMGTVSSVIGAEYARSRPSTNEVSEVNRPLRLMSSEFPVSEIWDEKDPLDNKTMRKDVEEFLFNMLGNGFQVDMNVIRGVLGVCGYDLEKSMEKLLNMSASTLDKSDNISSVAAETPMGKSQDLEALQCRANLHFGDSAGRSRGDRRLVTRNDSDLLQSDTDRYDLQKEVLQALFSVPERFEEAPRRLFPRKQVRRPRVFGPLVDGPLIDTITEYSVTAKLEVNGDKNEENEESYEDLRNAVKKYWLAMKDYYKAAADAYVKGNDAVAYKLLEEGHFFMDKARETNEKSAQMLVETRDADDIMSFDLQSHEPKEAIRFLKLHLTSLAGMPSFKYMKLILGATADKKEGARTRLIKKFLERDAIPWTEEEDGRIMLIRVDEIDPKRLSFAKK